MTAKKLSVGQLAFQEGYSARVRGCKLKHCPYHRGARKAGWHQGWASADRSITLKYLEAKK